MTWFVRLRWVAAAAALAGAALDQRVLGWFGGDWMLWSIGVAIVSYNLILRAMLRRLKPSAATLGRLRALAAAQIGLDMACLTLAAMWTGGAHSPLLGFFVFHMVFASLLLPRGWAYGGAVLSMVAVAGGLGAMGEWPPGRNEGLALIGWGMTLVLTVYLASHITGALARQRRRLARQNRRIRRLMRHLNRHRAALVQHEKMVAMGQMAAGVAHEIANPLASLDGLLQLVQRKPERMNPATVGSLREQVSRIDRIIRQMTQFAHPTDDAWGEAEINEVVRQGMEMLRFDGRMNATGVKMDLDPSAGRVRVLVGGVQQVLVNLIRNALDAMADSPAPALTVRTSRHGEGVVIEVIDNGPGIAPEHLPRLFEPFFTTKPVGRGTGLGLSISYSLIERQGGQIDVKSRVGEGATFRIKLPGVKAEAGVDRVESN